MKKKVGWLVAVLFSGFLVSKGVDKNVADVIGNEAGKAVQEQVDKID